jgi:hypothetical protein
MKNQFDHSASRIVRITSGFFLVLAMIAQPSTVRASWECPEIGATPDSCGQAICPEDGVQTSDALRALRAAVGSTYCGACRCDADDNGSITATDASRILRNAVGQPVELTCSACNALTLRIVENQEAVSDDPAAGRSARSANLSFTSLGTSTLPDGRTASLIRYTMFPMQTRLVVRDGEGGLISETVVLDNVYAPGGLDCTAGSERCVTRWHNFGQLNLAAIVINADSPTDTGTIYLKVPVSEGEGLTDIETGAGGSAIACDPSGICVAAWVLQRLTTVDQDFEESEFLGIFARAFHSRTGEMGDELFLEPTDPSNSPGLGVVRVGDNRFSVTIYEGENVRTRLLVVE